MTTEIVSVSTESKIVPAEIVLPPGEIFVSLDKIYIDPALFVRSHPREDVIDEYAQSASECACFKPIDLFRNGPPGFHILADGYHRVRAFQRARKKVIRAIIHEGGQLEALRFALAANTQHGIRRTNADKKVCIRIALENFPDQSDRAIAALCKVSHPTIKTVRDELANAIGKTTSDAPATIPSASSPLEELPVGASISSPLEVLPVTYRFGRDGKRRRLPSRKTTEILENQKESPPLKILINAWNVATETDRKAFMDKVAKGEEAP